jgi:hypothetical protein
MAQIAVYVLQQKVDCPSIQTRAFFLAFMPWGDVGRYFSLPPYTDNGVNIMMPMPPPEQQFKNFISEEFVPTTYLTNAFCYMTTFKKQSSDNINAFYKLCSSFSQCSVPLNDPYSCVNQFSTTLQDPHYKSFMGGVFFLLACKATLDVSKLVIILMSIWKKKIIKKKWTADFIKNSPFSPLLHVAGIDFYRKGRFMIPDFFPVMTGSIILGNCFLFVMNSSVLLHKPHFRDMGFRMLHLLLLVDVPMLVLSMYFLLYLVQTGLSVNGMCADSSTNNVVAVSG